MGTALQPYTYYGEFISLDGASAKGGGKAEYKSITPENVFFDDSKICFFNINLDRKGKKTEVTFKRTFHDLHYFTRIYLGEDYFIKNKANNIHHSAIPLPFPVDRKLNFILLFTVNAASQCPDTLIHLYRDGHAGYERRKTYAEHQVKYTPTY